MKAISFSKLALSSLLAVAGVVSGFSSRAYAGDFGLPLSLLSDTAESQVVIRVRNSSDFSERSGRADRSKLCGSGFNLSRIGIDSDGFDFPRPGAGTGSYDFPRPGGSLRYFQLPVGSKNPDIIGCVDTQRNIVFLNILKPSAPTPQSAPVPVDPPVQTYPPTQTYPPIQFDPNYSRGK